MQGASHVTVEDYLMQCFFFWLIRGFIAFLELHSPLKLAANASIELPTYLSSSKGKIEEHISPPFN
jgi:hypothetical protein